SNISILLSGNISETLLTVRSLYDSYFPGNPFDYYFMDDFFDRQYKADEQFGAIFTSFSIIAVAIACLGLFGLASFTLKLRVKEIGVRKVLGATVNSIVLMIFRDYVKLIAIAAVIGIPLVYFGLRRWLDGYATRIDITVDLLLLPVVLLLFITLITISYQSFTAASSNPTKSLRTE
ncbi:MAG: FtsX-like permease family protein, partial [Bacteroidota bacterium]